MYKERTPLTEEQSSESSGTNVCQSSPPFEKKIEMSKSKASIKHWFQQESVLFRHLPFCDNKPYRILVVDDQAINRELIVRFLHRQEYVIEVAENGQEAVEACQKKNYKLVLMDLQMPVMDGYEAARQIRELKKGHQPFIVAVSAHDSQENVQQCQSVGMNGFISKPIDFRKLNQVLQEISGDTEET
ncbi:response regulator [Anoxynatronum buryatiense]|uniref:Stage 0 sporulation protein A homolog n=1 Tax=Anoxynatronum buryatiense TaxID=489973 RepID=A0AA45WVX5_9CLOT|nr:response regulator [Anoxynatronum buryatiense]SMP56097.1 CheY chemotaxis protein or a CheY-like REC (receiver) domain [Anoxynatronum buryatiense]